MQKHVIITGGSRGLGQSLALGLAGRGDAESITLIARNMENLKETAEKISTLNAECRIGIVAGDLSNSQGIDAVITELNNPDIPYNVLINNAGRGGIGSLEETEDEEIEKIMSVNLLAPMRLIKYFLPGARKNKWGRIINISSISIFNPSPMLTPYIVSKSGLKSLSECISLSDIANGITCNTICPGLMLTDMGKSSVKYSFPDYDTFTASEIERRIAESFPAKKITDPLEVVRLIDFLVSDESGSISGEFFRIASGLL